MLLQRWGSLQGTGRQLYDIHDIRKHNTKPRETHGAARLNTQLRNGAKPAPRPAIEKATETPPRCNAPYMHVTGVRSTPALLDTIATI
jgi:hypothetical protein